MRWLLGFAVFVCCEPPQQSKQVNVEPTTTTTRGEACRDDIPDCLAACALRETHRMEFVDFYERRCAAVIIGKNPDKVDLMPTPYASGVGAPTSTSTSASPSGDFPPDTRSPMSLQPPPSNFDPQTVPRTGGNEPPECKAARMLRAQKRDREADMLGALCVAKGGDAGA